MARRSYTESTNVGSVAGPAQPGGRRRRTGPLVEGSARFRGAPRLPPRGSFRRGHVPAESLRRRHAGPVLDGRHLHPRSRTRRGGREGGPPNRRHGARHRTPDAQQGGGGPAGASASPRGRGRRLPRQARLGRLRDEGRADSVPARIGDLLLFRVSRPALLRPRSVRRVAASRRPCGAGFLRPLPPLHALFHLPAAPLQLLLDRLCRAGRRHPRPLPPAGRVPPLLPPLPRQEDLPFRRARAGRAAVFTRARVPPALSESLAAPSHAPLHLPARPLRPPDGGLGPWRPAPAHLRRSHPQLDPARRLPHPRAPRARAHVVDERRPRGAPADPRSPARHGCRHRAVRRLRRLFPVPLPRGSLSRLGRRADGAHPGHVRLRDRAVPPLRRGRHREQVARLRDADRRRHGVLRALRRRRERDRLDGLVVDALLVARLRVRLRPRRRASLRSAAPPDAERRRPAVLPRPRGLPAGAPRHEPLGRVAAREAEAPHAPDVAHGRPPAAREPRPPPSPRRGRGLHRRTYADGPGGSRASPRSDGSGAAAAGPREAPAPSGSRSWTTGCSTSSRGLRRRGERRSVGVVLPLATHGKLLGFSPSGGSGPNRSSPARTSTTCSRSRTRARSASRPRASTKSSRAAPRWSATSTSRATSRRASFRASSRASRASRSSA